MWQTRTSLLPPDRVKLAHRLIHRVVNALEQLPSNAHLRRMEEKER